jgi:hypothetical protein
MMNFKNRRNWLLVAVAVAVISLPVFFHLTDFSLHEKDNSIDIILDENNAKINHFMDDQNTYLENYFNSIYTSQKSEIEKKYSSGSISSEERDKELESIQDNLNVTLKALNGITNFRKDIFSTNDTDGSVLTHLNSLKNVNSDLKTEFKATLNGS